MTHFTRFFANRWTRPATRRGRIAWLVAIAICSLIYSLIVWTLVFPTDSDGATATPVPSRSAHVTQRLCSHDPMAPCTSVERFEAVALGLARNARLWSRAI